MKLVTSIIRRLWHLGNTSLLSYFFRLVEFISKSLFLTHVCTRFKIIMPLEKALWGRAARRNIQVPKLHNAPDMQPQGEVSNFEFREAIRMLSQVVTNQVGQHRGAWKEEGETSWIREFLRMNPQSFTHSSTTENVEKILRTEESFWYDEYYWCWTRWASCITSETCG